MGSHHRPSTPAKAAPFTACGRPSALLLITLLMVLLKALSRVGDAARPGVAFGVLRLQLTPELHGRWSTSSTATAATTATTMVLVLVAVLMLINGNEF